MADNSKIEWTDSTWNPITGCSVHSPGCTNCYAMKLAGTRMKHHWSRAGLTIDTKAGPVWTGEVRFNEEWLDQPFRWKRPRMIFVCAHADLFHESVPDEWIDRIFAVMALCPQHTFQVLTKRADRMRNYVSVLPNRDDLVGQAALLTGAFPSDADRVKRAVRMPLPNVWLGVSVEDQQRADERIPALLQTPAAKRFLSCEPLLGPIDLKRMCIGEGDNDPALAAENGIKHIHFNIDVLAGVESFEWPGLDWVIAGGESGPGARPMHPDWARHLRDQCAAAGTAFHFKQWGEWLPCEVDNASDGSGTICYPDDGSERDAVIPEGARRPITQIARQDFWRVGKKVAGRLLDGVEHNGFPA